ncbi:hypothetical protein FNF07_28745 [Trinickia caryophylli]|uniref:hypothetical protein n=1 Tax=Trinickia caryophylli TaxID=28094 RepID=UPI00117EB8EB|nr:hypothetical protein [Trinickia caryophylli]TRX15182.1 hypothetical protein FNF07_28745 [Trinickia caryophylli]
MAADISRIVAPCTPTEVTHAGQAERADPAMVAPAAPIPTTPGVQTSRDPSMPSVSVDVPAGSMALIRPPVISISRWTNA